MAPPNFFFIYTSPPRKMSWDMPPILEKVHELNGLVLNRGVTKSDQNHVNGPGYGLDLDAG